MNGRQRPSETITARVMAINTNLPPKRAAPPTKLPFVIYIKSSSACRPTSQAPTKRNAKGTNLFVDYSMTSEELRSYALPANGQVRRTVGADYSAILHNAPDPDARKKYLAARSAASPREKYFYPEATSYRYGWVTREEDGQK